MSVENDKIREKIRKLLALANDEGAMKGEIDNALRFARMLMQQHNLTEEQIRADERPKTAHEAAAVAEATEYVQSTHAGQGSRLTAWEDTLARAVCSLIGTVQRYAGVTLSERRTPEGVLIFNPHTGQPVRAAGIVFYGPAEDVEAAKAMMHEWSLTIVAMARMKYGGALRGSGRSYCEGFAGELLVKVAKLLRTERETVESLDDGGRLDMHRLASGTTEQKAIVLAERPAALALANASLVAAAKLERGSRWLEDVAGVKLVSRGRGSGGSHDPSAYGAGRRDGAKASDSLGYSRRPKLGGGS